MGIPSPFGGGRLLILIGPGKKRNKRKELKSKEVAIILQVDPKNKDHLELPPGRSRSWA